MYENAMNWTSADACRIDLRELTTRRERSYPVLRQHVFVELDSQSGVLRDLDAAIDDREPLLHQPLVELRFLHAILEVLGLVHGCEHVQARGLDDPGAPRMQHAAPPSMMS